MILPSDLKNGTSEPTLAVGVFSEEREGWHFRGLLEILKSPVCHPANNCISVVAMVTLSISRLGGMVLPLVDSGVPTLALWPLHSKPGLSSGGFQWPPCLSPTPQFAVCLLSIWRLWGSHLSARGGRHTGHFACCTQGLTGEAGL